MTREKPFKLKKFRTNRLFGFVVLTPLLYCFILASSRPGLKKEIRASLAKMIKLEGGSFVMGITSSMNLNFITSDTTLLTSIPVRKAEVSSFFMSATEVTNAEWKVFYQDMIKLHGKKSAKQNYYPDTALWLSEFPYSYNAPMAENYFSHAKFSEYPVVGITWDQANAYCDWKTNKLNDLFRKIGEDISVQFALPTEEQWEYGAKSYLSDQQYHKRSSYPWPDGNLSDQLNQVANTGIIYDINNIILKNYADDGCLYTCQVASYPPNIRGLYDMGGNVSEWMQDPGHSWSYYTQTIQTKKLHTSDQIRESLKAMERDTTLDEIVQNYYYSRLEHDMKVLHKNNTAICKGGSWVDGLIYLQIGSRQAIPTHKASTKIGFRVVMLSDSPELTKYLPKKNWTP